MRESADLDAPWARITPRGVQRLLAALPIRWWIAGGWALDVDGALPHRDIDVAVLRPELGPPENAVWARPSRQSAWRIDFKIEPVDGDHWIYRRDPTVRTPIAELGLTIGGIPFLAPAVARLYRDGSTATQA